MLLKVLIVAILCSRCDLLNSDPNGYIVYCPCMGRFGNQADHFLGALQFSKSIDRTLILPPWVEYRVGSAKSVQVPFDTYFKVDKLQEYHRVITMEQFMATLADALWPAGNRTVFCYMSREKTNDCRAKEGNPFGPFWDTFNVDFDQSEVFGPLHYDTQHRHNAEEWKTRYNATRFPVLAFMGAPAAFPVQVENRYLQRYLEWSDEIRSRADAFIRNTLPRGAFVGIHLRNGIDWTRACEHVENAPNLMGAPQCLGSRNEHGEATQELCFPSKQTILKQVKRAVRDKKAAAVFVASDHDYMLEELNHALRRLRVRAYWLDPADPHVELAILGRANHFIGNCISTFTAFAKRERDEQGFPSSFWAFPFEEAKVKEEL